MSGSSNLSNLEAAMTTYNNKKDEYLLKLKNFKNKILEINKIRSDEKTSTSSSVNDEVITKAGVVPVSMDNSKNKLFQYGLEDLSDLSGITGGVYEMPDVTADISDQSTRCDDSEMLRKCDSYAKLKNKPYYGLNGGEAYCECRVFDNQENMTKYTKNEVITPVNNIASKIFNNEKINYLGVFLDGSVYALKEQIYSENFNNLYESNEDKMIKIYTNTDYTDCNPFVGKGINTVSMNYNDILDTIKNDGCAPKIE